MKKTTFYSGMRNQLNWTILLSILAVAALLMENETHEIYYLYAYLFLAAAASWAIFVLILFFINHFLIRKKRSKKNLYHRTAAWPLISASRTLYPLADGAVYLTDSKLDLSNSLCSKEQVMLIFKNAQTDSSINRIHAHPLSWLRFKMSRSEWTAGKHNKIVLEEYKVRGKFIFIKKYRLEKLKGRKLFFSSLRVACVAATINFPLLFAMLPLACWELDRSVSINSFDLWSIRIIFAIIIFLIIGFFTQGHYNRLLFREESTN